MNTSGQGSEFAGKVTNAFSRAIDKSAEIALAKANEDMSETTEDMVNHPPHYTSDPSGVECITITRHRNFNIGNAIKYLWRQGLKADTSMDIKKKQIEDLKKSIFYIQDEIYRLENL